MSWRKMFSKPDTHYENDTRPYQFGSTFTNSKVSYSRPEIWTLTISIHLWLRNAFTCLKFKIGCIFNNEDMSSLKRRLLENQKHLLANITCRTGEIEEVKEYYDSYKCPFVISLLARIPQWFLAAAFSCTHINLLVYLYYWRKEKCSIPIRYISSVATCHLFWHRKKHKHCLHVTKNDLLFVFVINEISCVSHLMIEFEVSADIDEKKRNLIFYSGGRKIAPHYWPSKGENTWWVKLCGKIY